MRPILLISNLLSAPIFFEYCSNPALLQKIFPGSTLSLLIFPGSLLLFPIFQGARCRTVGQSKQECKETLVKCVSHAEKLDLKFLQIKTKTFLGSVTHLILGFAIVKNEF